MTKEIKKDQLRIDTGTGTKFEVPGPDDLDEAEANGVPYVDLCDPRSKYSPQKKMEVVAAYYLWGDSITAADKTGVNAATIRWWKNEATWWQPCAEKFWNTKSDELIAGYTTALDMIRNQLADAIKGEPIYSKPDKKTGEVKIIGYKKPSLRDYVMSMAIMQDKRAQAQGVAAPVSAKSTAETLKEAYDTFLKQDEELKKKRRDKKTGIPVPNAQERTIQ